MLRFAVAALAVSALTLGLTSGWAAAKPPEQSYPIEKPAPLLKSKSPLDPVWAKQLSTATKHPAKVTVPDIKFSEPPPNFKAVKRLDPIAKGLVLQTAPERVTGPIKYSVQKPYVDAKHYLEMHSNGGTMAVRTSSNYAHFTGSDAVMADVFTRPRAWIQFEAQPGRRYLLECLVDVSGTTAGNISARVGGGPIYSVNTIDRASLLFVHTAGAEVEQVRVDITGDRGWYLDGCELSWTGP
jgi:hypothetical protein